MQKSSDTSDVSKKLQKMQEELDWTRGMEERLREEIKNHSTSAPVSSINTFVNKPSCSTLNRVSSNERSIKAGVIPIEEEVHSSRKMSRKRSTSGDRIMRSSSNPKIRRVGSSHDFNIGDRFIPIRNVTVRSASV